MSSLNRKIECLRALIKHKSETITDLTSMLRDEKLVSPEELERLDEGDRVINLYLLLTRRLAEDKIMLLDFEWIVLPTELIKITVLTSHGTKVFSYSAT